MFGKLIALAAACALAVLVLLWGTGGFDRLALWAAGEQRAFQNDMALSLRALRGGDLGALLVLCGACFAYGFFHAVGPGHGKVLIGGYGLARKVSAWRLSVISLAASLGQALTAILLVLVGVWVLNLTRDTLTGIADQALAVVSYAAIALVGLWLVWRGVRHARALSPSHDHNHGHTHDHEHSGHDHTCSTCGHAHGPTPDEVANVSSVREALVLIAGIAIRPCTGALFVLLITWQMGLLWAGIAGTLTMALGTATVTIATGLAAVSLRGGLLQSDTVARAVPVLEIAVGLAVAVLAGGLMLRVV